MGLPDLDPAADRCSVGTVGSLLNTAVPPPTVRLQPPSGWAPADLGELWRYRYLVRLMALRDIRVRYKQSALGWGWALIRPLFTLAVFAGLFHLLLGAEHMPTRAGSPYALSTLCALVPWQLFARTLSGGGNSLVANHHLITKVYFPRLVLPVAPTLAALADFTIAFVVLGALMGIYGVVPGWSVLALPAFTALAAMSGLAVALWLSALHAIYRDVGHGLAFLIQLWMYATPVVYTTESVMADQDLWVRTVFALNPMAQVCEGFRWALLGGAPPDIAILLGSTGAVAAVLVGGLYFFRRMERAVVDLV